MIVSHRARAIFVHIQKTAGSSIEAALRDHDPEAGSHFVGGRRHVHAVELRDAVGRDVWGRYFKFAFVRNPWDRLVSWYQMCMEAQQPNAFCRYVRDGFPTFESFVTGATSGPGAKTTRNQLDYVSDPAGGVIVDFIGRYETLQADFATVAARIGIAGNLAWVNASRHGAYRDYYDDVTRAIVARRFARDVAAFDYRFCRWTAPACAAATYRAGACRWAAQPLTRVRKSS